ncbi:unnamed protein product [Ceutorhynchus assimilis]|uniref:Gag-like protein n=1 Tax=Ceutorhynchus assimilis TaxID=467358 RepID=A0A9N9MJL8_9CUCU|nr:unnamed protein product [Ceutorhynchus assimilis]
MMEKDEASAKMLNKTIKELSGNINTRMSGIPKSANETIYIRGMDSITTKEEVLQAIEGITGTLKDPNYRLSEIRPQQNGTQAITLTIDKELAEKLYATKYLRIGVVRCSMEKRHYVERCPKCWSHDHSTDKCQGPDRTSACFRCGGTGHQKYMWSVRPMLLADLRKHSNLD